MKGCDGSIKLADFGFAKRARGGKGFRTFCGTPKFMAPEIYLMEETKKEYDCLCDMWSVGVVMYGLICGYLPFREKTVPAIKVKITKGDFMFYEEDWESRPAVKSMVSKMLQVDPRQRMTAAQALECEWMGLDDERLNVVDLSISKDRMVTLRDSARQEKKTREVENPSVCLGSIYFFSMYCRSFPRLQSILKLH